jgi:Domain of unknown function (DUF4386)
MAAGLTAGAALVDYGISRGDLVLMGAVTGVGVGVLQALVLARSRVSGAFWWAIANPPAWALGWLVTSYVITRNVQDQFTNFGASGALVFGLLTWLLLAALFRDTEPQAHTMNMQNAAGVLLIVLPLAFNLFFFLLARRFDYPNILRSPSADVLSRFKAGGFSLKLLWYGFMLTAVLLAPLAVLLGQVLGRDGLAIVPTATTVGVLAAVVLARLARHRDRPRPPCRLPRIRRPL